MELWKCTQAKACGYLWKRTILTLTYALTLTFILYTLGATRYTLDVHAGVATTKHNLSSTGPGSIKAVSEKGTCVFCHTPHGAINPADGPLWNKTLSSAIYTLPSNAQGAWATLLTTVGQPDRGAKLCLSCHDGTVAIGLVVNTPGPGNTGQPIPMAGVTAEGKIPSTAAGYLGINISGHHPVSIAMNDTLRNDKLTQCFEGTAFYVDYPAGAVKLTPTGNTYKGNAGKIINGRPSGVQCASCHDPHNNPNGAFLVAGTPQNSTALCTACHIFCP